MQKLLLDLGRTVGLACLLTLFHLTLRHLWHPAEPPAIPVAILLEHRDHYEVVDARTDVEFASGHIPGAINLSISQALSKRAHGQPLLPYSHSRTVLVYCEGGNCNASAQVGRWLTEQGYTVRLLEGGYPAWLAAWSKTP